MKSLIRALLCFLAAIYFSGSPAFSQVGITAVSFLQINNDARSMGMGGATVALKHSRAGIAP